MKAKKNKGTPAPDMSVCANRLVPNESNNALKLSRSVWTASGRSGSPTISSTVSPKINGHHRTKLHYTGQRGVVSYTDIRIRREVYHLPGASRRSERMNLAMLAWLPLHLRRRAA